MCLSHSLLRVSDRTSGTTYYYEGDKDAEHRVRVRRVTKEKPAICHYFEGEQGAERKVRIESASGAVHYYDGKQGMERLVRADLANNHSSMTFRFTVNDSS
eukprot:COSAG01_NODE_44881_length_414_cov_1.723810_1_plen_100_part_01